MSQQTIALCKSGCGREASWDEESRGYFMHCLACSCLIGYRTHVHTRPNSVGGTYDTLQTMFPVFEDRAHTGYRCGTCSFREGL